MEQESKEIQKAEIRASQEHINALLQDIKTKKLPIIVLVEGWAAAGKGSLINDLISNVDPRFFQVFQRDAFQDADRYPFLYPYFKAIPENGKFLFMDSGWMDDCVSSLCRGKLDKQEYALRVQSVSRFERQLRDNGYLVIKLFVDITEKEQKERLEDLRSDKDTAWRVTEEDLWQNRHYDLFLSSYEDFMDSTSQVFPWHRLNGRKQRTLLLDALRILCAELDRALASDKYCGTAFEESFPMTETPLLADADLTASIEHDAYKEELKQLQKRISKLHNILYRKKIPVVICYEGWDAGGKGGNIRRLAYPLDPRGFEVHPIASPEPHELARHYLWRFWTRLPRSGHVAIFDRTWYGRVMVERIEGYCSEHDWQRAYNEINEFEEELHNWGAVVIKFWIHIDPETQLERFQSRQDTPEKRWKITDEDWRNREKWPQYEQAISEMLAKTSTTYAPWHIIESVDKHYARIKALRIVVEAMEAAIAAKS